MMQRLFARTFATTIATRPRRAWLYMPGSNPKFLKKAATLKVDTVCLDLEDAVAYNKKVESRGHIVKALNTLTFQQNTERAVRINPVGTGLENGDIEAILQAKNLPDAICLPKVEEAAHIRWLSDSIKRIVGPRGDAIKIIGIVESAKAMIELKEITRSDSRLEALIFGADDYAADVGAVRTKSNEEVWFARNWTVLHCKHAGLQAIDVVQINYKDEALLTKESLEGFRLGFTGKQIIHPNQIGPVQKAFSPEAKQLQWAKKVVDAFNAHAAKGTGAFTLDNKMIDMPTVKICEKLLARGRACGLI